MTAKDMPKETVMENKKDMKENLLSDIQKCKIILWNFIVRNKIQMEYELTMHGQLGLFL